MKGIHLFLSASFLFLSFNISIAQVQNNQSQIQDKQRVIGPSPEVSSLFKFVDMPVSLYTGTPEIKIPIYTIKIGTLEVPLTLMYHAGGIKVAEIASWTGLGWSLNAGGAITSSINGLSDIDRARMYKTSYKKCDLTAILNQQYDTQPDLFYFSFPGQTGQFYLNDSAQIRQIPYSKIKIEEVTNPSVGPTWKITNTDGNIFIFNKIETSVSTRQTIGLQVSNAVNGASVGSHPDITSRTWYLTKIISPLGDSIVFNYSNYYLNSECFNSETEYIQQNGIVLSTSGPAVPPPTNTKNYEFKIIAGLHVSSIVTRNCIIQFIPGGNRCDLLGDQYLSEIDVKDAANNIIKKVTLNYNYLVGNALYSTSQIDCSSESQPSKTTVDPTQPSLNRRLMLTEVDEVDTKSASNKNAYTMNYEHTYGLPSRFSGQQDYWGYYNGNGQDLLLQTVNYNPDDITFQPVVAGRNANITYTNQGTLTQITYPTGGSSNFKYELNNARQLTNGCGPTYYIPSASYSIAANVNNQFIGSFTINHCQGGDSIAFQINGCAFRGGLNSNITLPYGFNVQKNGATILSSNNIIAKSNGNTANGAKYYLQNGAYSIYSFSASGPACTYTLTIPSRKEPQFDPTQTPSQFTLSGLRIRKITTIDPLSKAKLMKLYEYQDTINGIVASSGIPALAYNHLLLTNSYYSARDLCWPGDPTVGPKESSIVPLLILNSNTNCPLTVTHGSTVGYEQVTEYTSDSANNLIGKTEYHFSTPSDQVFNDPITIPNDYGATSVYSNFLYPFAPPYCNDWQRGLLLKKIEYKSNKDNTFSMVRREQNYYSNPISMDTTHGTIVDYYLNSTMPFTQTCTTSGSYNPYSVFEYNNYPLYSRYVTLDSLVTEEFDAGQNEVKTKKYFSYNTKNLLPSVTKTISSKNELITTNVTYPLDYTISGTASNKIAQGIQNLQAKYIITPVIEQYIQRSNLNGSNLRTVSAILNTYKQNVSLPDVIYKWEGMGSSFLSTVINNSSSTMDINYKPRIQFNQYDNYGNILDQQKTNDVREVYLWSYNGAYPVAQIIGSDYTTVNNLISQSQIDAATSIPNNDVNVRVLLNNLRINLPNAQVNTYTYAPLIGMSSSTNPQGVTTNYTYDTFNRLYLARNDDKNVLARYRYAYKNNPDNGMGGYSNLTASVTPGDSTYTQGSNGSASVTASGGSGSYSYNWSLLNGSSIISTGGNSNSFSFTCSQSGTLTVQCVVTDNTTGETVTAAQTVSCVQSMYHIYLTNNSGYNGYTFPMYIDGTLHNFPANGVSNQLVATIPAGTHTFMFPCGPTSSFVMTPNSTPIPAGCGTNFSLTVSTNLTFSFYTTQTMAANLTTASTPPANFCTHGCSYTQTVYLSNVTYYYDSGKTQPVKETLIFPYNNNPNNLVYVLNGSGVPTGATFSCP